MRERAAVASPLARLSRVYFSGYAPNGELARRLRPVRQCVCRLYQLLFVLSVYIRTTKTVRIHTDSCVLCFV